MSNAVALGLLGVVEVLRDSVWEAESLLCCGVGVILGSGAGAVPRIAWDKAASSSGLGVVS